MFVCNVLLVSFAAMAQVSVATLTVTPNVELDAAAIDKLMANVNSNAMKKLMKSAEAADKDSLKSRSHLRTWYDALDEIKQVTIDAVPQLLEFLVKDDCLRKGKEQMKFAYICQMDKNRKKLKTPGDTLSSCLAKSAETAEESALIKLFEAKLKLDGAFCGKVPKDETRYDGKLGLMFFEPTNSNDHYMGDFIEKVARLFPNNERVATIQKDAAKQQAAGFFAELFKL